MFKITDNNRIPITKTSQIFIDPLGCANIYIEQVFTSLFKNNAKWLVLQSLNPHAYAQAMEAGSVARLVLVINKSDGKMYILFNEYRLLCYGVQYDGKLITDVRILELPFEDANKIAYFLVGKPHEQALYTIKQFEHDSEYTDSYEVIDGHFILILEPLMLVDKTILSQLKRDDLCDESIRASSE